QTGEIYEKLWFSGRLEDEKKVPTLILPHPENTTVEGDATIDVSTNADATSVYRGSHGDRDTRSISIWVHKHRLYSHPLRFILTPSAKELGITFRPGIEIAYMTTIRNRHSETVDRALILRNSIPGTKFHRGACLLVHRLSYPLGRTWIFVHPAIGTAREAPIRNRHFNPVGTRSHSEISSPAPKFLSGSVVAGCRCDHIRTPLRSNGHNFPLGYQNHL
ncbi:hypothetical protein Taro_015482, partial [Colocasia esculenta]|nr:hypothetical protein [Colocasia esculenta]